MSSWRKNLVPFDEKKANQWMAKNSGKRIDPNQRIGARYIPNIETTKLPADEYPGGYIMMRILPGVSTNPCPSWIFTVQEYYLRDFVEVLKRSDINQKHLEVFTDKIHSPATMDPKKEREDPLNALRRAAYEDNSEHCREWAKKLFTKSRHYMNVIARLLPVIDDRDKLINQRNVGPRVFRLPQEPVEIIMMAFKDPEIGDPTDVDEAFDFKYWMERRKVPMGDRDVWMPQYDHCGFSRKLTAAGSEAELDYWMTNLPNLHDEYVETSMKDMAQIADLCEMVVFDRIKIIHPVDGNKNSNNRPSDETDADDVEFSDASGRSRRDTKEEEKTRSRRTEPKDEEKPRSRRTEPEDEEKPRSRRTEPEDEEKPRSRRTEPADDEKPRSRRTEPEDEEKPRSRRTEPEDEEKPRSRRTDPEDDEKPRSRRTDPEDEEKPRSRARVVSDDDGDNDGDDWLDNKLAEMEG
jgi:hypothetical protein